jgi:hypothetical protein
MRGAEPDWKANVREWVHLVVPSRCALAREAATGAGLGPVAVSQRRDAFLTGALICKEPFPGGDEAWRRLVTTLGRARWSRAVAGARGADFRWATI